MKNRIAALILLVVAETGLCAGYQILQMPEASKHPDLEEAGPKKNLGVDAALPAYPKQENLVEFYVAPGVRYQVFVDLSSLTLSEDSVIRFSTVVKTEGGANNVSYVGISCDRYARILYASGRSDGSWSETRNPAWQPIDAGWGSAYYRALVKDVLCDVGTPNGKAADMIRLLKNGRTLSR